MAEIRVEIDAKYLKELKELLGNPKNTDLVSNALAALRWIAEQTQKGQQVVAESDESQVKRELVLPILSGIRRAA